MRITDISKTKAGRYSIIADGVFLFSIHADTYATTDLSIGQDVSAQRLEEIRAMDEMYSCKEKALSILSYSAQTKGVLMEKLTKFYPEDVSDAVVNRMEELGLINDADYAKRYALDLINLKGFSMRRVKMELLKKKIDKEIIDDVLADVDEYDEEKDLGRILHLIRKKYMSKLTDRRGIDSVIASLCRQGFEIDDIRQALIQIKEEAE